MNRERICFAPGINGAELMKSLAMQGRNSFNFRIVTAGELARMALMRSGVSVTETFLSISEETAVIAQALQDEPYFETATYSDIRNVAAAVRKMRSLVSDKDEEQELDRILKQGDFPEKNAALLSVYKKYMKILADKKYIDYVSLVKKAIRDSQPMDADFYILREYPLNPMERLLLEKLSGGSRSESSLLEQFGAEEKPLKIESYQNCYGAPNEVETILTKIYESKNLDRCTVAVTNASIYGQLFFDYALLYDMPITLDCGVPILNSNPAKLLTLYHYWMTGGFFGAAAIGELLSSDAFNRKKLYELYPETDENFNWGVLSDVVSSIRFTNDAAINAKRIADFEAAVDAAQKQADPADEEAAGKILSKKLCIPYLKVLAKELALEPEEFIYKYSYLREGRKTNSEQLLSLFDHASVNAIYDELKVMRQSGISQATEDMIRHVLKLTVSVGGSQPGELYVTGIDGALTTVRDNLYIAGLSASNYPGSPREDYLLLDTDLERFGEGAKQLTSSGRIEKKQSRLLALARLYASLGASIHVSYAGLNVSELKRDNASSLIFELYREESGKNVTLQELEDHVIKVGYFEPKILATRKVGEAYNEGKQILLQDSTAKDPVPEIHPDLDRAYSPSALSSYFGCPRSFLLGKILRIPEPQEEKPFEVIAATDFGTLAHTLMEELGNSTMSVEDFLKRAEEVFDNFTLEHPPLVAKYAQGKKEEFLEMMENAYLMDPHREVVLEEEDIACTHESGVKLHGFPDRVEKLDDGSYLVVDFKTGRNKAHVDDDIATCLQVVLYSYLLEQKGYRIAGAEYRYLRLNETVTCKYDTEIKDKLNEMLTDFKNHMAAADFPIPDNAYAEKRADGDPDPCEYCKYGMICGKYSCMEGTDHE
ncbi:MAG: PD-(D/E)XK nuclease family protein [Lachnospiraceae bacterium]|nr:PD-(D/E)XK nuclease family protein [Lachnospiraceae bacterium]